MEFRGNCDRACTDSHLSIYSVVTVSQPATAVRHRRWLRVYERRRGHSPTGCAPWCLIWSAWP